MDQHFINKTQPEMLSKIFTSRHKIFVPSEVRPYNVTEFFTPTNRFNDGQSFAMQLIILRCNTTSQQKLNK